MSMSEGRPDLWRADELEDAVRGYLAKASLRYLPFGIGLLAVALIVALVPSVAPNATTSVSAGNGGLQSNGGSGTSNLSSAGRAGAAGSSTVQGAAAPGTFGSPSGGGPASSAGGTASSAGGTAAAPAERAAASSGSLAPEASGIAVTGVRCGAGVRQFQWSVYAPRCTPAWNGNNGGATSSGVTASTITLTYREPNEAQESALGSASPGELPSNSQYISDLDTFVSFFNKQYELYGRHVVLKPFQGQGDWLAEDAGQDLEGAQADAVTAHDIGGFADVTYTVFASVPYAQSLADEKVISFDAPYEPESWYEQYSPYEYNYVPTGNDYTDWSSNLVCQRMAGLDAAFAGEADFQHESRKFGIINIDSPSYAPGAAAFQQAIAALCGAKIALQESYAPEVTEYQTQSTTIIAKMKAAGVTTINCLCDGEMDQFLARAADQQEYYPEWITNDEGDASGRQVESDQEEHAFSDGPSSPPMQQTEAYHVFKLADPSGAPAEPWFQWAYQTLVLTFNALQAAGPDLTPQTFEQGMFSLPPSVRTGNYGNWAFGTGAFTPETNSEVTRWSPTIVSGFDGAPGTWAACGDAWYPYDNSSAWGPAHTQLSCP